MRLNWALTPEEDLVLRRALCERTDCPPLQESGEYLESGAGSHTGEKHLQLIRRPYGSMDHGERVDDLLGN